MNSSTQVEKLAFVKFILHCTRNNGKAYGHRCWWVAITSLPYFFSERGNEAKAESDVERGGSRVLV